MTLPLELRRRIPAAKALEAVQMYSYGKQTGKLKVALKKSELYSSVCGQVVTRCAAAMDASQYKDYVLVCSSSRSSAINMRPTLRAHHHPARRQLQEHGRAQGHQRYRRPDQQENHRSARP